MNIIEAEAAKVTGWVGDYIPHRDHHQEHTVPQQQQPARIVDSLHAITAEIQANPLVARLIEHGLGTRLTGPEADHFAALIASLEQNRGPKYAQLPPDTAPHDGGTQQQPIINTPAAQQ